MEKKFKETNIPEDYSKALAIKSAMIAPCYVDRILTTLFHGISKCLGDIKNVSVPKAIAIRSIDHTFLVGAKIEYISNSDNPTDPSAGRWDYSWTFYEDDLKGADCIDIASNSLVNTYFASSGLSLYNMKFMDSGTCIFMMVTLAEMIINWLKENASSSDEAVIYHPGVFKATASVVDGKVEMGIVPDGEMKVLVKNDSAIQEI